MWRSRSARAGCATPAADEPRRRPRLAADHGRGGGCGRDVRRLRGGACDWPVRRLRGGAGGHTTSSAWCGEGGSSATMASPANTSPLCSTMLITPALSTSRPRRVAPQRRRHQAGAELIELQAGVAQAGELDHRGRAQMQARAGRQSEERNIVRGDVLADVAGCEGRTPPHAIRRTARHAPDAPGAGWAGSDRGGRGSGA